MTTLAITILGGAYNKSVSRGDLLWDKPYDRIPSPLQAYMVADVRFGHLVFNVLLTCLLREMFPDPEVACRYTVVGQHEFIECFADGLVLPTLYKTEIYPPAKERARTREQLIASLRYRDAITNRMVDTPERVKLYATLLNGATPTVGHGGARYLHL